MKLKDGKVDISEWSLEAFDKARDAMAKPLLNAIAEAASEAITLAMEDTRMYFPAIYDKDVGDGIGGPPVRDPLTIYLRVDLGSTPDDTLSYELNLRAAFKDGLDELAEYGSNSAGWGRISVALRDLCDDIDRARAKADEIQKAPARRR